MIYALIALRVYDETGAQDADTPLLAVRARATPRRRRNCVSLCPVRDAGSLFRRSMFLSNQSKRDDNRLAATRDRK